MLDEVKGSAQPSEILLTHCPFWILLYNLPLNSRSEKDINTMARSIGEVMEVENDGIMWDKSMRVRVMLNVVKPLRRILHIKTKEGNLTTIDIKYERLPTFCYACGRIGHIERDCEVVSEEERGVDKMWLRASPRKGRIKMQEEVKNFLKCSIFVVLENNGRNTRTFQLGQEEDSTVVPLKSNLTFHEQAKVTSEDGGNGSEKKENTWGTSLGVFVVGKGEAQRKTWKVRLIHRECSKGPAQDERSIEKRGGSGEKRKVGETMEIDEDEFGSNYDKRGKLDLFASIEVSYPNDEAGVGMGQPCQAPYVYWVGTVEGWAPLDSSSAP
ncbi:hypothetical protein RDABS01_024610 [Bienertia sinuspersici]